MTKNDIYYSKTMTLLLILFLFAFVLFSCATKPTETPSEMMWTKFDILQMVNTCTDEQIELCGDLICEGDWDPEIVIQGTGQAIMWCIENDLYLDWHDGQVEYWGKRAK